MLPPRRLLAWAMVLVLAASVATWWTTHEPLPRRIRIATGHAGGLYHDVAMRIAEGLERHTGRAVEVLATDGSIENRALLESGGAELAILQAASLSFDGLAILAPLYPEPVHVIARAGRGISTFADLAGHRVSLGPVGAGMRESALSLLEHYAVASEELGEDTLQYYTELATDDTLDGAIVTTGIANADLNRLLGAGGFELLPVLDAAAIAIRKPLFQPFEIPRGLYHERPPVPATPLATLATTAVLAAGDEVNATLVSAALGALYEQDLRLQVPTFIARHEALEHAPAPLHPRARAFLNPYEGLSLLTNFVETLSGIKELVFGLVALGYLLWERARRVKTRRHEAYLAEQKEHLDAYLRRTVDIERDQMRSRDPDELRKHLEAVTRIKIEAIEQLTHEDLLGDRMFMIFLMQCHNLARKIQDKMSFYAR